MRIAIITLGTRGDVQPYVALGLGLRAAGHDVRLVTQVDFEAFVRGRGLGFCPVQDDVRARLDADEQAMLAAGRNPLRYGWRLNRVAGTLLHRQVRECWDACQDADALMFSAPASFAAYPVAEKLAVPAFLAPVMPISPTRAFPTAFFPAGLRLGGAYNRLTWLVGRQIGWQLCRQAINRARQEVLGLPPSPFLGPFRSMVKRRYPFLYGYSPSVLPKPPDWGDWLHVTGYWFLDRPVDWQPPPGLVDFLGSGPPPVYVGFGGMNRNTRSQDELIEWVVTALARAKQRGVLSMGVDGVPQAPVTDEVFTIDSVPHDWLFPRMAAVVHHGGAGTTAAGLRAGVPSVIVPFFADQLLWGRRVYDLGVGPKPIPRKQLSVERLAHAIGAARCDQDMRRQAAALGERIRAEDGVARAVEVFHHVMRTRWGIKLEQRPALFL